MHCILFTIVLLLMTPSLRLLVGSRLVRAGSGERRRRREPRRGCWPSRVQRERRARLGIRAMASLPSPSVHWVESRRTGRGRRVKGEKREAKEEVE